MKDTKFTPGPWELQRDSGLHIYIAQPQNTANRQPGYYAEVRRFTSNQDMVEANAHLIAAAPDLYEAASNLLNRLDLDKDVKDKGWWKDERESIAAVLAKARGETQPKTGNQQ